LGRGRSIDQIPHGLRLKEVELAVEHRSASKFSRNGGASTTLVEHGNQLRWNEKPTVTTELDQIFAGVAAWRRKERHDQLVNGVSGSVERGGNLSLPG
jgi:hypothetical protein